jgi:hypothetical protein
MREERESKRSKREKEGEREIVNNNMGTMIPTNIVPYR